jgi:hypothetical protein
LYYQINQTTKDNIMANLFNKAKKVAVEKPSAKEDKKVRINVGDTAFFDKIQALEFLNDRMKADKAKADMISDEVREVSKEKWAELYQKTGKNPGSVMVEAKSGLDTAQVMFVPTDRYITINAEKAETLREEYGDDIVEETTTFSFDDEMIQKYGEVLSSLIENSDEIADADKDKIIKAITKFTVAKGTIDVMKNYGKVNEVMEAVRPVVMLKGPEVIKG